MPLHALVQSNFGPRVSKEKEESSFSLFPSLHFSHIPHSPSPSFFRLFSGLATRCLCLAKVGIFFSVCFQMLALLLACEADGKSLFNNWTVSLLSLLNTVDARNHIFLLVLFVREGGFCSVIRIRSLHCP